VVIDADTRQALATFSQAYDEVARRRVSLKVPASGYRIEPGDLYALVGIADGFDNEVFKCTSATHGANWIVDVEGEAILRCSIYGPDALDTATFDPAAAADVTLSGGNLVATNTGTTSTEQGARIAAAHAKTTGKYYFEMTPTVGGIGDHRSFGIGPPAASYTALSEAVGGVAVLHWNGHIWASGADTGFEISIVPATWTVRIACDFDNHKVWFSILEPGGSPGDWNGSPSADPATNVGGVTVPSGAMVPFCAYGGFAGNAGQVCTANFGGSFFAGSVPSGFIAGWTN